MCENCVKKEEMFVNLQNDVCSYMDELGLDGNEVLEVLKALVETLDQTLTIAGKHKELDNAYEVECKMRGWKEPETMNEEFNEMIFPPVGRKESKH